MRISNVLCEQHTVSDRPHRYPRNFLPGRCVVQRVHVMPRHWMPFYVGDYLADTPHLDTEEHGAYLLLIFSYWSRGKALPDDDKKLQAIAKQPLERWLQIRPTLEEYFDVHDGYWFHERVEAELEKSRKISEQRSEAGRKGGSKSKANAQANAKQVPKQTTSNPQPPISLSRGPLPKDWEPDEETIRFAQMHRLPHSSLTVQKFKDHFASEDKLTADPNAAYRKWLTYERPGGNRGTNQQSGKQSTVERVRAKAERREN